MRTFLLLLSFLLLTGCGPDESKKTYTTLSEIRSPRITLKFGEGRPRFQLVMDNQTGCPSFSGTALMNGEPLKQLTTGGLGAGLDSFAGIPVPTSHCFSPEWSLPTPLPVESVTELAIQDKTGSLTMGVANLTGPNVRLTHCEPTPEHCRLQGN